MQTIHIDFDVFKEITARRINESMTENDVIRNLLGLDVTSSPEPADDEHQPWQYNNVTFPHGTEFRAFYKFKWHSGKVLDGSFIVENRRFLSPSSAARSITHNSVNGWRFWECKLPGDTKWALIDELRKHNEH